MHYDTCLRKSALLNLTWSDFIEHEEYIEIKAIDKGNEERNLRISKEFYDALLQIKSESKDGKVFNISETSIQDMMNYLKSQMQFEDKRNVVFHSIRKCGVTFQFRLSNDIMQAKKAAGHSNLNNTSHEELLRGIESLNKDQRLLLNIKLNEIIGKK